MERHLCTPLRRGAPALLVAIVTTVTAGLLATSAVASPPPAPDRIAGCNVLPRGSFSNPTTIDNQYLPLTPGTRFTLEGRVSQNGTPLPHQVVFTVTDVTKVINGVRTVVVLDQDLDTGELLEEELSFWAQDDNGTVWNLGEYPEEYAGGVFAGAPLAWVDGVAGAIGGVHMLADPTTGRDFYVQGSSPTIDFLDCARLNATGVHECVPVSCYDNGIVTVETSPLAGTAEQLKFHAPGIGIFKIAPINDPEGEDLVMVSRDQISPTELAAARDRTLLVDRHGYVVSPDVYGTTPLAESPVQGGGQGGQGDDGDGTTGAPAPDDDDQGAPPPGEDDGQAGGEPPRSQEDGKDDDGSDDNHSDEGHSERSQGAKAPPGHSSGESAKEAAERKERTEGKGGSSRGEEQRSAHRTKESD